MAPRARTSAPPRWQMIENVVAACERIRNQLPGTVVTQKAMLPVRADPMDHREVDVLIQVPVGGRDLLIGVEVKERGSRKLHTAELGSLIDLKNEVGLHYLCVVCTRGFSPAAQRKARRHDIQLAVPEQIVDTGIFAASRPLVFEKDVTIEQANLIPLASFSTMEAEQVEDATRTAAASDFMLVDPTGAEAPLLRVLKADCERVVDSYDPLLKHDELLLVTINGLSKAFRAMRCRDREIPLVDEAQVLVRKIHKPIRHEAFRILGLDVATFVGTVSGEARQITLAALPVDGSPGAFRIAVAQGPLNPPKVAK